MKNPQKVSEVVNKLDGNNKLVKALETWEGLFLCLDGESISVPDYTYVDDIEKCINQGRLAIKEAKEKQ